jgi:hypothetical protein
MLAAIHPEYVKTGLNQSLGRLPVKVGSGMAATGQQLKSLKRVPVGSVRGD